MAAGQVEEARALCVAQVDEMMDKLNSDAAYRGEYTKLWGAQRKYIVSELLPTSGPPEVRPAAAGAKGAPAAKGKPSKPQGAQKAAAIIASLMEQSARELAEKARMAPPPAPSEPSEPSEPSREATPEPEPVVAAPKVVRAKPSADIAVIKAMSEIPQVRGAACSLQLRLLRLQLYKLPAAHSAPAAAAPASRRCPTAALGPASPLPAPSSPSLLPRRSSPAQVTAYDADFKAPVVKDDAPLLSAAELKERIREEQRAKSAEAELRKKRRQETLVKKKEKGQQMAQVRGAAGAAPRFWGRAALLGPGLPRPALGWLCPRVWMLQAQRASAPRLTRAACPSPPSQERAKAAAEAAVKAAAAPEPVPVERAIQRVSSSGADEAAAAASSGPAPRAKHGINVKALVPPAVPVVIPRAKPSKDSWEKKLQQAWKRHTGPIVFVLVMLLVVLIAFATR